MYTSPIPQANDFFGTETKTKKMLQRLIFPLPLIGILMWPALVAQECTDEIPEDVLLDAQFLPADNKTSYPETQIDDILAKESSEIQESIRASQALTDDTSSIPFDSEDTCQRYDYQLPYKLWYFYNFQQLRCFSLYPIYIAWCRTRYCRWNYDYQFYWWYRCVQEWRHQYFWSVCMEGNGMWSVRYLSWKLPACCNCMRYYRYTREKCKITEATVKRR
ncbi:hypothetical protein CHS0354_000320 [Potamilus streckersoni]|uniref:Uncharacterized protein n=1 Tax=Potamilus streckersoni TaxID=2493646 RepID=A0AAE0SIL9_9BIVA|nr:hypothetical protein CHS0354_000320 [Potamilus streckersoni]